MVNGNDAIPSTNEAPIAPRNFTVPEYGTFVIPAENTWPAHAQIIKDEKQKLKFSPVNYPHFDKIIADKLRLPALTDPAHTDYSEYAALRHNIAGVRNYIFGFYHDNKKLADKQTLSNIENMAAALGEIIDKNARPSARSISIDAANIEGAGAMEMYKYLGEIQDTADDAGNAMKAFKAFMGTPKREWGLPPLPKTPFSLANLAKPEDPEYLQRTTGDTPQTNEIGDAVTQSIAITEGIVTSAQMLQSIDTLAEIPREQSIEEARIILRGLRNMEFSDRTLEEFLDQGTPTVVVSKKQNLSKLVNIFAIHLRHMQAQESQRIAQESSSSLRNDPIIQNGVDAASTIALEVAEHTRRMLADKDEREKRLNDLIDAITEDALLRQNQSVTQLLDTLELGLERATGREVDLSPLDRLMAAQAQIDRTHRLLQHPEEMEVPAKEESIELAREILRRMQNMSFSEMTLEQFIAHGKSEDKAAFAHEVGEVGVMLRNIINEASQSTPDMLQTQEMKNATDSFATFSHAVSLMAAREMPGSVAAAQQISAEATRDAAQLANMKDHTINRVLKSAEGALEKAIGEISQQQDEEQAQENGAQEAVEQALQQSDQAKRKKRKGGESKSRSGKGGKKQRKAQQDISADDAVLKQGAFKEAKPQLGTESRSSTGKSSAKSTAKEATKVEMNKTETREAAISGLKPEDLAAIRQLGGSLRNMGKNMSMKTVTANEKIAPDDKSRTQKVADTEQQKQTNPRGNNGPRV